MPDNRNSGITALWYRGVEEEPSIEPALPSMIAAAFEMRMPLKYNFFYFMKCCKKTYEKKTQIDLECHDVETQSCVPEMYDYVLLSPDWTWQQYSM